MKQRFLLIITWVALSSLIFISLTSVFLPIIQAQTNAVQDVKGGVDQVGDAVGLTSAQPEQVAARIINVILSFLGIIFLALAIYAGFLWMTAAGEEKKVAKAKDILKSAIIGLVIILAAYLLTNFVIFTLIIPSTSA